MARFSVFIFCLIFVGFVHSKVEVHWDDEGTKEADDSTIDLLTGDWQMLDSTEFSKDEKCAALGCKDSDVCVIKGERAICVDKEMFHLHSRKHAENVAEPKKPYPKRIDKYEGTDPERCSDEDLAAMPQRILQWAKNIHQDLGDKETHSLPHHTTRCDQEGAWMFNVLDGNHDGVVDADESADFDNDPHESCMRPFIDRCDTNANDVITLDEWCDCLSFADDDVEEPICHAERKKVNPHNLLGKFYPRCDVEGLYRPKQCHEAQCWCVDKYGREFDGSRVDGNKPDCGQFAEEDDE